MSENIQNLAPELLPEINVGSNVFEASAADEHTPELPPQPPIEPAPPPQNTESSSELKAIAKALMVNLTWAMAGLFNKE